MVEFNFEAFSKALKDKRIARGLSQSQLSGITGIHRINILRYEQGYVPHVTAFYVLRKWLNQPMESFFTTK
jgi:transcriptional regulator with XRE-family HTH domain